MAPAMNWEFPGVSPGFRKGRRTRDQIANIYPIIEKVKVLVVQSSVTLSASIDCSHQAPLSTGVSRQEYWSRLPFPSPGNLPNWGIKPKSPTLQTNSLPSEPSRRQKKQGNKKKSFYFCIIDYTKAFECVDHNKVWKILKVMARPDHLNCLLRNLYTGSRSNS